MISIPEILTEKKLKKTPLRIALLEIFFEKNIPLSIQDLEIYLQKKELSPNQTSLYRQMESLCIANVFQKIETTTGKSFYELKKKHHHHFFCENCKSIKCIYNNKLETAVLEIKKILIEEGNQISKHHFSISGKCKNCKNL